MRLRVLSNLSHISTAGLDRFPALEFRRKLVGLVGGKAEFSETVVGYVEGSGTMTSVYDDADADGLGPMLAAFFECFDDASTAGNDVFHDQHFFAGFEPEVAAQFQLVVDFFEKEEAQAELAGDFLADHKSAHGWAHDGACAVVFQHRDHELGESRDLIHVLANLRTLEEVCAMQAGTEQEVAFEQGTTVAENLDDFFVVRIHEAAVWLLADC